MLKKFRMFVFYERGDPAPTLTFSAYLAFGIIKDLLIFVKVGAM